MHYQTPHLLCLIVLCLQATPSNVFAQKVKSIEEQSYIATASAEPSQEEINRQKDLWIMEVSYRPMRMIPVRVTDPKTGKKSTQFIWYLVYKAINRPVERRLADDDTTPENTYDPQPKQWFIPEFTLLTEDNTGTKAYPEMVIPEAQAVIAAREKLPVKNSVQIVQQVPKAAAKGSKDETVLYGVATWKGIDQRTDRFKIFLSGFSNGYQCGKGPNGKVLILRKTIVQEYWRPGDQFDPSEREFRNISPDGETFEPAWIYRPDEETSEFCPSGFEESAAKAAAK